MRRKYLLLAVFLLLAVNVNAQTSREGSLSGFIYDDANKEALIGVNIYFPELGIGGSSNTSGYYIIPQIPAGSYTVVCEYIGYQTRTEQLTIASGEAAVHNFTLTVEAVQGRVVEVVADSIRTSEKLYEKPLSTLELTARQIKAVPQVAEADLLRSLQTLPGILPVSDFSSALYVRGGTPDQNLYLLDGTDVYNPEHAFGIFSTFNTDAIKHIDISKGGFSAAYGGRLSSVLDIINLDGNRERFQGSAAISLLSAKTTLQMPIGNRGAISGSIRRTYFDKTIRQAIDDIPDYYFYDGNLKAFFDIDKRNKLTLSGYGGRDVLRVVFNNASSNEAGFQMDWGNRTGSLKWTRVFNPQLFANFWITGSRFTSDFDFGETVPVTERNLVTDVTLKGNLEYHYSRHLIGKFGFEQKNLHLLYREDFPEGGVDVDRRAQHYVAYGQANWRPTPRWDIEAGLRYNNFTSGKSFQNWEPRFSAKYRLSETVNLKAATGLYYQYLQRIPRTFFTDIWTSASEYYDPSSARHYILGFQKEIANDYQLEVETYYKEYDGVFAFDPTFLTEIEAGRYNENGDPIFTSANSLFDIGDGDSYGFEMLLRKDVGAVSGWIGYAFAETEYRFPDVNGGAGFAPRHDRRSTLNLVGNIDIKNTLNAMQGKPFANHKGNWTLGLNLVYASGQPITAPGSAYITGVAPNSIQRYVEYYPSAIGNLRLPAYARLDVSLAYLRQYRGWSMSPYLQVFNIGNRKNVWYVDYKYSNGLSEIETVNMFPILPTFGINFNF